MAKKRITELATETTLKDGQYVAIDHTTDGTKKYNIGAELTDLKEELEHITGISDDVKVALLQIASKVAYIDEDGQDYYDDLYDALYPPIPATGITLSSNTLSFDTLNATQTLTATITPSDSTDTVTWASSDQTKATVANGVVTSVGYGSCTITATAGSVSATCSVSIEQASLSSISAVYTQSGTVYDTASLDSLKTDLVVTAHWSNSTTSTVASTDYTLSGTLTAGTSTITVSYGGKTTTFTVTVTATPSIAITWSGTGTDNTSTIVDATSSALYLNIPFESGATQLKSTATASTNTFKTRTYVYNDAECTDYVGNYWIDTEQIDTTSRTGANNPWLPFDTKTLIVPQGYYAKIIVAKSGSDAFASNGDCRGYLNAYADKVTYG